MFVEYKNQSCVNGSGGIEISFKGVDMRSSCGIMLNSARILRKRMGV